MATRIGFDYLSIVWISYHIYEKSNDQRGEIQYHRSHTDIDKFYPWNMLIVLCDFNHLNQTFNQRKIWRQKGKYIL